MPMRITSVIPTAMMAFTEVCWQNIEQLFRVKKFRAHGRDHGDSTSSAINDFCSNSHSY